MSNKRRRERDRPKIAPGSTFNPHKRVLLSYGSDEEEEEEEKEVENPIINGNTEPSNGQLANYHMQEYSASEEGGEMTLGAQQKTADTKAAERTPDDQKEATVGDDDTAPGEDAKDIETTQSRRHTKGTGDWTAVDIRKNQSANQFPALGLASYQYDDEDEEEEYDSATEEAMAYLKAVRSERQGMPEILTTSRQVPEDADTQHQDDADDDVLVGHGTYIGRPDTPTSTKDDATDPQNAYTQSLKGKFLDQRTQLHVPTSENALAELKDEYPVSFPFGKNKAYVEWHGWISSKPPKPDHLRALDQETVFAVIALFQKHFLVKGKNLSTLHSAWIWTLLAKLDDVGTMDNDQVFLLRELGKKAVLLQLHFSDPEAAAQLETLQQSGSDGSPQPDNQGDSLPETDLETDNGAAEKERSTLHDQATENTLATLDMILVVIGDIFGQRDLLQFRRVWTPAEKG